MDDPLIVAQKRGDLPLIQRINDLWVESVDNGRSITEDLAFSECLTQ